MSGITRILNARFFINYRHLPRLFINSLMMLLAYILISISTYYCEKEGTPKDWQLFFLCVCLFATLLFGISCTFGDSAILGYLKGLAPDILLGYSSGTGFAGVLGAGIALSLSIFKFSDSTVIL